MRQFLVGIGMVGLLSASDAATWAAESQQSTASPIPQVTAVYVPPKLGAPKGRVGGGARGPEGATARLAVLAPDHPGLTTEAEPSLYWFISQGTKDVVEFTLMSDDQIDPLLEVKLVETVQAGVYKVALRDYGVKLEPGSTYRWYVSLIQDRTRRSRDLIAGGVIQRVPLPEDLSAKLAAAKPEERPKLFASAGIWYDAITTLSSSIEASSDQALREQRAVLLDQVGLPDVAKFDRSRREPN